MRLIRDTTGRFRERPHFDPEELDGECDYIITSFLRTLHGELPLPIPTDSLTKLIERDAAQLDLYADLRDEDSEIHGMTEFFVDRKPIVRIARELSEQPHREHRLRTTLTHEYGHVKFHSYLYATQATLHELHGFDRPDLRICNRQSIVSALATDWMEWQAGFACGALLMPLSLLKPAIKTFLSEQGLAPPLPTHSEEGRALRARVATTFDVSDQAADVRLNRLHYLVPHAVSDRLL